MARPAPAPLGAELLGVRKGEAAPASDGPTAKRAGDSPRLPHREIAGPDEWRATVPIDDYRRAMTVRLPPELIYRLRRAAFEARAEIQVIVELAIGEALSKHGF